MRRAFFVAEIAQLIVSWKGDGVIDACKSLLQLDGSTEVAQAFWGFELSPEEYRCCFLTEESGMR